jgi:hypothetical protein
MPTIWVRKIDGGLDARRLPETTAGGALIKAEDGHLNRGGEFEKRAAFVPTYDLPAGTTVGIMAKSDQIYVLGSVGLVNPGPMPADVGYQNVGYTGSPIVRIVSWELFEDSFHLIARRADDTEFAAFDGALYVDQPVGATFLKTISTKAYATVGPVLQFSAVGVPYTWTSGTGFGFIDMSQYMSGAERLTAIADYQNLTAVFAERVILIWSLTADPADSVRQQTLRNTGTASPRSVTGFGDGDVFYLDESGLRSLRARDSSNAPSTAGIGVRVDSLIVEKLRSMTEDERSSIIGLVEPQDGRFWLIMKDTIFVLTYFPEEKISGWTLYTTHYFDDDGNRVDFDVDDAVVFNRRIYLRTGDKILVYGGLETGTERDATEAEAWLTYLDADNPAKFKRWRSLDAAVSGEWAVAVGMSLRSTSAEDDVGIVSRTTYNEERIPVAGESTHISVRFRSRGSEAAVLSACAIHYDDVDDGDRE